MTGTDLAIAQPQRGTIDLVRFAEEAASVHGLAEALSRTSFVPATMRGKPDDITACILYGRELHMDPMTALRTINVIEGQPSLTANAMRGLAQDSGVKFHIEEQTDTRVIMHARAPGDAQWTTSTWTWDRAKKMGLDTKANWKKMPSAMLVARATSELVRLVAANVLLGMPYSSEELGDGGSAAPEPPAPVAAAEPRTVRRKPVQATVDAPLPEPDPETVYVGPHPLEQEATDKPITESVRKALMVNFQGRTGIKDRGERLAMVSKILGREITSVNDLTNAEGLSVLRVMSTPEPPEGEA